MSAEPNSIPLPLLYKLQEQLSIASPSLLPCNRSLCIRGQLWKTDCRAYIYLFTQTTQKHTQTQRIHRVPHDCTRDVHKVKLQKKKFPALSRLTYVVEGVCFHCGILLDSVKGGCWSPATGRHTVWFCVKDEHRRNVRAVSRSVHHLVLAEACRGYLSGFCHCLFFIWC